MRFSRRWKLLVRALAALRTNGIFVRNLAMCEASDRYDQLQGAYAESEAFLMRIFNRNQGGDDYLDPIRFIWGLRFRLLVHRTRLKKLRFQKGVLERYSSALFFYLPDYLWEKIGLAGLNKDDLVALAQSTERENAQLVRLCAVWIDRCEAMAAIQNEAETARVNSESASSVVESLEEVQSAVSIMDVPIRQEVQEALLLQMTKSRALLDRRIPYDS